MPSFIFPLYAYLVIIVFPMTIAYHFSTDSIQGKVWLNKKFGALWITIHMELIHLIPQGLIWSKFETTINVKTIKNSYDLRS